jgi:CheY-like chemotaxis protein
MPETPVVLVVDADADHTDLYAGWLESAYDVRVASDGRAALAAVDDADAVVLGPNQPKSPGLVDALRARVVSVPVAVVVPADGASPVPDPDERVDDPPSEAALRAAVAAIVARRQYTRGVDELFALAAERAAADGDGRPPDEEFDELSARLSETLDDLVESAGYRAAYRAATDLDGSED